MTPRERKLQPDQGSGFLGVMIALILALVLPLPAQDKSAQPETCPCEQLAKSPVPTPGIDYIYVVDVTESMTRVVPGTRNLRWAELKGRLLRDLAGIHVGMGHSVHVMTFGGEMREKGVVNWRDAAGTKVPLSHSSLSAYSFRLEGESDRQALLSSIDSIATPAAGSTPLRCAILKAYEKARQLKGSGKEKVAIWVYTDGEDNVGFPTARALQKYEDESLMELGDAMVDGKYVWVQVGDQSFAKPPTANCIRGRSDAAMRMIKLAVDHMPAISLADGSETSPVDVIFEETGLSNAFLRVFFQPAANAPRVAVVCAKTGKDAVFHGSGKYSIKFKRRDGEREVRYQNSFGGWLVVQKDELENDSRIIQVVPPEGIRVDFLGRPTAAPPEIDPPDKTRILVGTPLHVGVRSPVMAKYHWVLGGSGSGSEEGPGFTRVFDKPGWVDLTLTVDLKGTNVPQVNRRIQIIDPGMQLIVNPSHPVVGEMVEISVKADSGMGADRVLWSPPPVEEHGFTARYRFSSRGTNGVTASLHSPIGNATRKAVVDVGAGFEEPELIEPSARNGQIRLCRASEPQQLKALAGEDVTSVEFVLEQSGRVMLRTNAGVVEDGGLWTATASVISSNLAPGAATLTLRSLPGDAALMTRLGAKVKKYEVDVTKESFYLIKEAPLSGEFYWGKPTTFTVRLEGPGKTRVESLEWYWKKRDGTRVHFRVSPRSEWVDFTAAEEVVPQPDAAPFKGLGDNGALQLVVEPQGDPSVVQGVSSAWDGLIPEYPPARFEVRGVPREVDIGTEFEVWVEDRLGRAVPISVSWSMEGEGGNPLKDRRGTKEKIRPVTASKHVITARVGYPGGEQQVERREFQVNFKTVKLTNLAWNGAQHPTVVGYGEKEDKCVRIGGNLEGSMAALDVNIERVVKGRSLGSIPGYPKTDFSAEQLAKGVEVAYPPVTGNEGDGELLVTVRARGLDQDGKPCEAFIKSFRILNKPSRFWQAMGLIGTAIGLWAFGLHMFRNNGARFVEVRVLPGLGTAQASQNLVQSAMTGLSRIGPPARPWVEAWSFTGQNPASFNYCYETAHRQAMLNQNVDYNNLVLVAPFKFHQRLCKTRWMRLKVRWTKCILLPLHGLGLNNGYIAYPVWVRNPGNNLSFIKVSWPCSTAQLSIGREVFFSPECKVHQKRGNTIGALLNIRNPTIPGLQPLRWQQGNDIASLILVFYGNQDSDLAKRAAQNDRRFLTATAIAVLCLIVKATSILLHF